MIRIRLALLAALLLAAPDRAAFAAPHIDGTWLPDTLPALGSSRAVVDTAGDRLLLFQATAQSMLVWTVPLSAHSGGSHPTLLTIAGTPPGGVQDATFVYDGDSSRVVMYGGWRPGSYYTPRFSVDSLFFLRLGDSPRWERPRPINTPPLARQEHVAAYYAPLRRMVVHGGLHYTALGSRGGLHSTWMLRLRGTLSWDSLETTGRVPRTPYNSTPFAGADKDRTRLVVGDTGSDTTWMLSLGGDYRWTYVTHGGARPPARRTAAIAAGAGQLFVLGQADGSNVTRRDAHALDFASLQWRQLTDIPDPAPFTALPFAAVDGQRERLWLGGQGLLLDGAWTTGTAGALPWTRAFGRGPIPGATTFAAFFVDPVTNTARLVGEGAPGQLARWDIMWSFALDGADDVRFRWRGDTLDAPIDPARESAGWAFDSRRRALYTFGGYPGGIGSLANLGRLSLDVGLWETPVTVGTPPSRSYHSPGVYDALADRVYFYKNRFEGEEEILELWSLSLGSSPPQWSLMPATDTPALNQSGETMVLDSRRGHLLLFGGANPPVSHIFRYDPAAHSPTWTKLAPSGAAPPPRGYASVIYDPIGDRLVVHGGLANGDPKNDTWALSLGDSLAWTQLSPENTPQAFTYPSAVYDAAHDRLLLYGGQIGQYPELQVLQWERDRTPPPPLVPPSDRMRLSVLANPSLSTVRLSLHLPASGEAIAEFFDIGGRRVFRAPLGSLTSGPHVRSIATGLGTGLYWVRVRLGGHEATSRITILN